MASNSHGCVSLVDANLMTKIAAIEARGLYLSACKELVLLEQDKMLYVKAINRKIKEFDSALAFDTLDTFAPVLYFHKKEHDKHLSFVKSLWNDECDADNIENEEWMEPLVLQINE